MGWWRIDPATGETTDVMDDASGTETVEYGTIRLETETRWIACRGPGAAAVVAIIVASALTVGSLEGSAMWRLFSGPNPPGLRTPCVSLY